MEERQVISHAQVARILRRAGYTKDQIDDVLRDLPDPLDLEQHQEKLFQHGISRGSLMDRRGGSP